ncbi:MULTISPECIES: HAD family hydrolase [Rhizobium/Agrobacterium group]|uniref:Mannosylfructose-phosphate phosphatase n=1 Tax=Agrobacterium tomkonis CFBP 6623 TaxID=1183432 RepID=A0A1S7Q8E8_9HYPH|nr:MULTISPECIES: HAD family hydrolase [Rhizobium/Agrobacterium group]KRA58047.1 mannosylfructose-phosphate phosphatase [Rhizobium sp. Root651]QCL87955.1 HAD-IIB family hydrolase [Agrobacterium tumefaciens]TKT67410.1 HAD-IIB family hydrolase [Agrobacterium sp. LC34]CUX32605.1 Mannosylfructose-phosphate phosphatase [Agrobacterium tomkonis CFBP 6623]
MRPLRLFSTDLDGTVVGNNDATRRFRDFWQSLPDEHRPVLVFNSGRLVDDQLALLEEVPLPRPDYIIGGVGTMLHAKERGELESAYRHSLGTGFDPRRIADVMGRLPDVTMQEERYQHGLKSSWFLHDADEKALADIEAALLAAKIDARIVYSSGRDLDILPKAADKGAALAWLCGQLHIGLDESVVAGDTGNDRAMFELNDVRGVIVGNALPELVSMANSNGRFYLSGATEADGVIEGLRHWGLDMGPAQFRP